MKKLFLALVAGLAACATPSDYETMCAQGPEWCRDEYKLPPCDYTPGTGGVVSTGQDGWTLGKECRPPQGCIKARIDAEREGREWPC